MKEPSPMPDAVIDAIFTWSGCNEKCPTCSGTLAIHYPERVKRAYETLRKIEWHGLGGHYGFWYAGMFVGVETDGYMHT